MSSYRNNTESFYREIIHKVSSYVKEDFHNEGIGEDVIQDMSREKQEVVVKKEEVNNLEDESLSSISQDSDYIESEAKDFLLAQYDKVHRVRNKWKCTFKDAVLHINGKEYVFERVVGELERDW